MQLAHHIHALYNRSDMAQQNLSFEKKVIRFIEENRLVSKGDCLLLAVSGGPDSVCLLHLMVTLKDCLGIKLHIAHLDHQLRGDESTGDAVYVTELAEKLGVPLTLSKGDVNGYREKHKLSLEEAARDVRYSFLAETAVAVGAVAIFTGHTLDDQVETILLHIIRGSGIHGLVGLKPKSSRYLNGKTLDIIRPLLEISRDETQEYCRQYDLMPRSDSTNLSLSPLRNRIRQKLLPELKNYNPRVVNSLLRTSSIVADEVEFLDNELKQVWDDVVKEMDGVIILDKEKCDALPTALKRHMLRVAIKKLLGTLKDIEERHIEEIIGVSGKQAGKYINLPYGLIFAVEYGRYILGNDAAALCLFPEIKREYIINIPGETLIPGWRIETSISGDIPSFESENEFTAFLDIDECGKNLFLRKRIDGDRFQPLGFDTPKRLNRFMIDLKIPQGWRERIPLVCCHGQGLPTPGQCVWLVGYRIDERYKITSDTKRVLKVEFKRV